MKKLFVIRLLVFFLPTAHCLLPTISCEAQSDVLKYAHQIIDTLCSPSMHGRGYVNKGDSIAADYIKKEFIKLGVKPIGKEFEQRFSFPVNTFPKDLFIYVINDSAEKLLIPGKEYIVGSSSTSFFSNHTPLQTIWFDSSTVFNETSLNDLMLEDLEGKVIVLDTVKISKQFYFAKKWISKFSGTIFIKDKLIFDLSKEVTPYKFSIDLLRGKIDKDNLISVGIDNAHWSHGYQTKNILGYIKGTQYPDSFIVFSAHYDHLGQMGKDVYFPGANDNASGCAMLLNLAKYFSQHPPKYSVAFFAFGAEEVGLLGSKYYVEHPLFPLKQINFLVNLDLVGTGDEGIKVVNATEHKKEYDELVKINSEKNLLPVVSPRGKAANSDHYFFEEAGVKTFFIYTLGGIKAYHDIYDRPETLPLTKFNELYSLLLRFTDYLQR